MVTYKELVKIIQNVVQEYPAWQITECTAKYIKFHKTTDSDIFTSMSSNFKNPGYILSTKDHLFEFIINSYSLTKIKNNKCFDSFAEYNLMLQDIYDLTNHLQHTLVPYDYSPFCLLSNPEKVLKQLFAQSELIEDDIRKDIVKLQEKTLAFDIEHFDSLDGILDMIIEKTSKLGYSHKIIMQNKTIKGLSSSVDTLYKTTIVQIGDNTEFDISVDSNNKFRLNFSSLDGVSDYFNAENSTYDQIISYIPACINMLVKLYHI